MMRRAFLGILLTFAIGCDYTVRHEYDEDRSNPTGPSSTTPAAVADVVEFRVNGDLPLVMVRVTNSIDGFSQTNTVLPYTHRITLPTNRDRDYFLSLDARGNGAGFLHAAIFVNGYLFREASNSNFNPIVTVTGTYRRGQ